MTWQLAAFAAVIALAPVVVFAAAVLLDHIIHGPNRPTRRRDQDE